MKHETEGAIVDAIVARVANGPGTVDAGVRSRVLHGEGDPTPLAGYLAKVRAHAYRVTDDDLRALRAAGYSEDAIFELTVAAALGESVRRARKALDLLHATRSTTR